MVRALLLLQLRLLFQRPQLRSRLPRPQGPHWRPHVQAVVDIPSNSPSPSSSGNSRIALGAAASLRQFRRHEARELWREGSDPQVNGTYPRTVEAFRQKILAVDSTLCFARIMINIDSHNLDMHCGLVKKGRHTEEIDRGCQEEKEPETRNQGDLLTSRFYTPNFNEMEQLFNTKRSTRLVQFSLSFWRGRVWMSFR
ncbi:magnesium-protoporphyrin IX monomethyl ester oxidative cyclase, partial [Striga asiatica]